ncbi:hypothetical protein COLO4_31656 [Corchorus olitorius]|uniref:Uncharacterized protein n=1 Tax=Corchorus olitorius TaxID=93759 RepID=A0A1R3H3P4_9ROSI|nr:hypothetical protein COLO4_31656 [Corchorus olitorius]
MSKAKGSQSPLSLTLPHRIAYHFSVFILNLRGLSNDPRSFLDARLTSGSCSSS